MTEQSLPTFKEFMEYIRKNGFKQGKGHLFYLDDDGEFAACALGQGLLNAKLANKSAIHGALTRKAKRSNTPYSFLNNEQQYYMIIEQIIGYRYQTVIGLNDNKYLTCEQIADTMLERYPSERIRADSK